MTSPRNPISSRRRRVVTVGEREAGSPEGSSSRKAICPIIMLSTEFSPVQNRRKTLSS